MKNILEYWIRAKDATGAVLKSALQKAKDFGKGVNKALSGVSSGAGFERVKETAIHTDSALDTMAKGFYRVGLEGEKVWECMDVLERAMDNLNKGNIKAADLFEITRKSLSDVGLTAKQVEEGINILKRSMVKDLAVSGKEASRQMRRDFTGARGVVSALNGDIHGLGRAFVWLIGHIKKLNLSATMLSAIGFGVYAIIEAVSKCVSWWQEKKKKMEEIQRLRFENTLKKYEQAQDEVNSRVNDYCDKLDHEIERKRKLIEQNERLKSQELERLRIAELAAAKTDEERKSINQNYDAEQAKNKAEAAVARAEMEIDTGNAAAESINALIIPLRKSLEQMKAPLAELEGRKKKMEERGRRYAAVPDIKMSDMYLASAFAPPPTEEEKQKKFEEWQASDEEYKKLNERVEKMRQQYKSTEDAIKGFEKRIQRELDRVADAKTEIQNVKAEYDIDVWRDQEESMYSYYQELARLEEESAEQAWKDAEEQAQKKARLDKELHEQRMKAAEDELRQFNSMQSAAESRLAAAQSQVSKAWGFYRDKGKMQEEINDYNAQKKAEEQWVKDFERLRSKRRDWRDIEFGQLSAEEEAVRQVALAKEEERAAQVALDSINEQTARAADAVEEIHKILSNGGEP